MDITTIIGLLGGVVCLSYGILSGGSPWIFINIPSIIITIGGATMSTVIAFPLKDIKTVIAVTMRSLFYKEENMPDIVRRMLKFALKARREGILALEAEIENEKDPFVTKALQLAIDGTSPEVMDDVLRTELSYLEERHNIGQNFHKTLATFAPAFGLVGTLIGLIQMLRTMSDPSTIGPNMAVAMITTFYGAIIANGICLPIAGKLNLRTKEELLRKEMIITGILSIQSGDNPRIVEEKLKVFMPPRLRTQQFGEAKGVGQELSTAATTA